MGPTAELMAGICGFSQRSLFRELQNEGKTYQEMLDAVRFERACNALVDAEPSIK